jgi:hypothetical protein
MLSRYKQPLFDGYWHTEAGYEPTHLRLRPRIREIMKLYLHSVMNVDSVVLNYAQGEAHLKEF